MPASKGPKGGQVAERITGTFEVTQMGTRIKFDDRALGIACCCCCCCFDIDIGATRA